MNLIFGVFSWVEKILFSEKSCLRTVIKKSHLRMADIWQTVHRDSWFISCLNWTFPWSNTSSVKTMIQWELGLQIQIFSLQFNQPTNQSLYGAPPSRKYFIKESLIYTNQLIIVLTEIYLQWYKRYWGPLTKSLHYFTIFQHIVWCWLRHHNRAGPTPPLLLLYKLNGARNSHRPMIERQWTPVEQKWGAWAPK